MSSLFRNKYFAGGLVFVAFQWLAYVAYTGGDLTSRSRGSTKGIEDLIGWLSGKIGTLPAAVLLSVLGTALGYYAYKRMARMTGQ